MLNIAKIQKRSKNHRLVSNIIWLSNSDHSLRIACQSLKVSDNS